MPPCYDIYGLTKQRNRKTIEKILNYFANREKIEKQEGCGIFIYKTEKYSIKENRIPISTLTEVINYGIENKKRGFYYYLSDNLKTGINYLILKFTFDEKIIFGISIEEKINDKNGQLIDNYKRATEVEKIIGELANTTKTSIQCENAPADDEEDFDEGIITWQNILDKK